MKIRPLLFSLAAACCLLCAPLLAKAAVSFDHYVVLTPGEDYLLPPDGIVSDVCVSDGSVLSVTFDEMSVSLSAQEPGVTSLLIESESTEGTVYDLRTVLVTAGGTCCWPAPAYSSSRDMSIARGFGLLRDADGHIKRLSDWKYEADQAMYRNKKHQKQAASNPAGGEEGAYGL